MKYRIIIKYYDDDIINHPVLCTFKLEGSKPSILDCLYVYSGIFLMNKHVSLEVQTLKGTVIPFSKFCKAPWVQHRLYNSSKH